MHRILAIDPDPTILELLKDVLELEGYQVTTARSLEESEALLRRERFAAILVDYQVLRRWYRHPSLGPQLQEITRSVPILCLSTAHLPNSAPPPEARAIITKPFAIEELVAALESVMESARGA